MKVLNVVETAYRATIEEQDDTILWLNAIFKNIGLDTTVLLRSNAVNYALAKQDSSGLKFGGMSQNHPTDIVGDIKRLLGKGLPVKVVKEDLKDRGISESQLIPEIEVIPGSSVSDLMVSHTNIWHW